MVCGPDRTSKVEKQILERGGRALPPWWSLLPAICAMSKQKESRWAHNVVIPKLNAAVRAAAEAHEWTFVGGIAERFIGHGYPANRDRYIVRLNESANRQRSVDGMLHPNGAGHDVYATRITRAIREGLGIR